ncbi:Vacuolar protein-sorting-associated protein 33 [Phlyctochytrium bullatum]|nr:Vacuolar protein-sorting-associated protein 33 [Phlyctochytrium bullatum]
MKSHLVLKEQARKELLEVLDSQQSKSANTIDFSIFFVPRRTLVCEQLFEEQGVLGDIVLGEFHLDLIPLDEDVYSLELDDAFRDLYLDGDVSPLYYLAKSILKLETVTGEIPKVLGVGKHAKVGQ